MNPMQFLTEFLAKVSSPLIIAYLLTYVAAGYLQRAILVALLGLFVGLEVDVSH